MQTKLTRGEQALIDLASVTQVATVNVAVQSSRTAVNALEAILADAEQVVIQSDGVHADIATHFTKIRHSLTMITDTIQQ